MAPKKEMTQDALLEAGMRLLKKKSDINARSLAKEANCSTQPIYDLFGSMEEYGLLLTKRIRMDYYDFIQKEMKKPGSLFMNCLKGYISYAVEKPELFYRIFVLNPREDSKEDEAFDDAIVTGIQKAGGYSKKAAFDFFIQSWVFAHGLAMQVLQNYTKYSKDEIDYLLQNQFEALKNYYRGK